ncbi:hypothetical protein D9619_011650 [Psilocybe cf. subviscida]|uniref:Gluconokinase n=1 Tax=Psilocybe cf. subviscida TaxID=2480587 RepID=A0A8H5BUB7_9AGAR|nr:hypothetical protein D9619_011650 [Psilocybe cf. subviscida]
MSLHTESTPAPPFFVIVMGVSGTGKTTLGAAIAKELGVPYVEGDGLHPKANVDKMASGQPLNDADREPWLELVRTTAESIIVEQQAQDPSGKKQAHGVVISCSALKTYYREILRGNMKPASKDTESLPTHLESAHPNVLPTYFVFIEGDKELLMDRMTRRVGHYMKANMLESQLDTLEDPTREKGVVAVSSNNTTEEQLEKAKEFLLARINEKAS